MKNQLKAAWEITQTFATLVLGTAALVLASFYGTEKEVIRFSLLFLGATMVLIALAPMATAYVNKTWPKTTKPEKKAKK